MGKQIQPTVKIVSDGTPAGTQVLVDGKMLEGVMKVTVYAEAGKLVRASIELVGVRVETALKFSKSFDVVDPATGAWLGYMEALGSP